MIGVSKELSISEQCRIIDFPRSRVYREATNINKRDLEIMHLIDQKYTEDPTWGSRRLSKYITTFGGVLVGRDRVRRLMREMGIAAIYPKKSLTSPGKGHKIYPYLLRNISIERVNQVWSTDITYIKMKHGFAFLTAVIDWYSRKVLSWRVSNTMDVQFCTAVLEEALDKYGKPEIFNTDQGSQYTSNEFTSILKEKGIKISMDGKGRALDNIFVERLWRSVKQEEVYLNEYNSLWELRESLGLYFEKYNKRRPHQSLGYNVPNDVYWGKVILSPAA